MNVDYPIVQLQLSDPEVETTLCHLKTELSEIVCQFMATYWDLPSLSHFDT